MSKQLINQYYNQLDRLFQFSKNNYEVVCEVACMGTKKSKVVPNSIVEMVKITNEMADV